MFRIHQRSETELLHGIQKPKECDLEAVSCNVPGIKKSLLQTSVICSDCSDAAGGAGLLMQEVGIMQENVARIIAWGDSEQVIICQDKNVHCGHLSYIHSKDSSDI